MGAKSTKSVVKSKPKTAVKPKNKSATKSSARLKNKPAAKPSTRSVARSSASPKAIGVVKPIRKSAPKSSSVSKKTKTPAKAASKPATKSPAIAKTTGATKPKRATKGASRFDEIKRDLIAQREELLAEAGTVMNTTVRVGSSPDLTDQASAETDQAFVLKLKEREQKLLKKIDETLERISEGGYGICQSCDEPIPLPRLKARPVTTLCIECKTIEEEEENLRRG